MSAEIVPDSQHRGLVGLLPPTLRGLALLARFDRPIGWWLLFWPGAWGVALAGGAFERFGLILWLLIQAGGLIRMETLRRRFLGDADRPWIAPLATALQSAQIIFLVGALFVGIAFQPFMLMLVGVQIGFDVHLRKVGRAHVRPMGAPAIA